jgi:hypothetical protein
MPEQDAPYEVGYAKPPKAGQFAKGESGNPKGRPKGSKNFANVVLREARQRVRVNGPGRVRSVTKLEAAVIQLNNKAAQGELTGCWGDSVRPCPGGAKRPRYSCNMAEDKVSDTGTPVELKSGSLRESLTGILSSSFHRTCEFQAQGMQAREKSREEFQSREREEDNIMRILVDSQISGSNDRQLDFCNVSGALGEFE